LFSASTLSTRQRLPLRTWSIRSPAAAVCAGFRGQGGVVVAAQDEITGANMLVTGHRHTRSILGREVVVEALVDGVGDIPSIA
jgi:hypothetical protein